MNSRQSISTSKGLAVAAGVTLLTVIGLCSILAVIGGLGKKSEPLNRASLKTAYQTPAPTAEPPTTAEPTTTAEPSTTPSAAPPVNELSAASSGSPKSQRAQVISANVNLRENPAAGSGVSETIPEDTEVTVLRQKGAWFYVQTSGGSKGWLHGNTIRLADRTSEPAPAVSPVPVTKAAPAQSVSRPPIRDEINNSGATARCRDGSLSYSAQRRGTCSHHGGVAVWY